jgi:hypothetical protein|tara:strand:+ start:1893 stop:2087 length:195 start_codon:yes stop_codon:yes gene_type:complete
MFWRKIKEIAMPNGKGTYGKTVGRPPAKKKAAPKKKPRPAISAPMGDKRAKEAIAALKLQKKKK